MNEKCVCFYKYAFLEKIIKYTIRERERNNNMENTRIFV